MYLIFENRANISSSQNLIVWISIAIDRLIRRPPDSCMPRQFLNDSLINEYAGIEVIVLSQFCTFTVVNATSMTSPSAPYFGISIQSPTATILFALSCMPATSPSMASLNTSKSTAINAPNPLRKYTGLRSNKIDKNKNAAYKIRQHF